MAKLLRHPNTFEIKGWGGGILITRVSCVVVGFNQPIINNHFIICHQEEHQRLPTIKRQTVVELHKSSTKINTNSTTRTHLHNNKLFGSIERCPSYEPNRKCSTEIQQTCLGCRWIYQQLNEYKHSNQKRIFFYSLQEHKINLTARICTRSPTRDGMSACANLKI